MRISWKSRWISPTETVYCGMNNREEDVRSKKASLRPNKNIRRKTRRRRKSHLADICRSRSRRSVVVVVVAVVRVNLAATSRCDCRLDVAAAAAASAALLRHLSAANTRRRAVRSHFTKTDTSVNAEKKLDRQWRRGATQLAGFLRKGRSGYSTAIMIDSIVYGAL